MNFTLTENERKTAMEIERRLSPLFAEYEVTLPIVYSLIVTFTAIIKGQADLDDSELGEVLDYLKEDATKLAEKARQRTNDLQS